MKVQIVQHQMERFSRETAKEREFQADFSMKSPVRAEGLHGSSFWLVGLSRLFGLSNATIPFGGSLVW